LGRLIWRVAEVVEAFDETPRVRTLSLLVRRWPGHVAGQHLDVRLTAPDGYRAQRSYSIATPASGDRLDIAIERLEDGEVSPYLNGVLAVGDRIEMRGPIGGHFVWEPEREDGGPVQLVAGGSGIVPLMAMARARVQAASSVPMRMLVSSRTIEEIVYRDELERLGRSGLMVTHTLTRAAPTDWPGYRGRVDERMLAEVVWPVDRAAVTFVCGPTSFVESVAADLLTLGHAPGSIKTERFGPTGG
jgi:ferredoxin-NADP reductase